MKAYVYYIGKARDANANGMAEEYIKRTTRYLPCEMREIRPDRFDLWSRHASATRILLDPAGKTMDSARFAALWSKAEMEGRDLVFLIGGADGLPPEWRPRADLLLSLSAMTFPHEFARVMLCEQIYRAVTTLRGHPYPR
ncbi:MAG TPA: 23S rRNA (pseudouridine(1915)-N(3))-methyltransferase RlmH [Bryobacteraceae bacterium]